MRETLSRHPLDREAESGPGLQALHPRPLPQGQDSGEGHTISVVDLTMCCHPRVPTGTRIVPTGKRRRQKVRGRGEQEDESVEENDVDEEERRLDTTQSRRKLNRLAATGGRRTPTPASFTGIRGTPRRRLRPSSTAQQATDENTESPTFSQGPAIRVKTVSKVTAETNCCSCSLCASNKSNEGAVLRLLTAGDTSCPLLVPSNPCPITA